MENLDNAEKAIAQLDDINDQTTDATEVAQDSNPLANLTADQIQAVIAAYEAEKTKVDNINPDDEDPVKVSRNLVIISDKRYGLVKFKREGGGKIPTILSGTYNSVDKAERDLHLYQSGLLKPTPMQATDTHSKPIQADNSAATLKELQDQLAEMKKELAARKEEDAA